MNFDLTSPCADCPFRNDIRPYLTKRRAAYFMEKMIDEQKTFTCHKTTVPCDDEDDEEGGMKDGPHAQHCAGALILLEKLERPNQMMRWMERIGLYDRDKLKMDAPVFDTAEEFIQRQDER